MAQYRSASTNIIRRRTKKFTPDDAYTDHYFLLLSVLEMLRDTYIQEIKKDSANPDMLLHRSPTCVRSKSAKLIDPRAKAVGDSKEVRTFNM